MTVWDSTLPDLLAGTVVPAEDWQKLTGALKALTEPWTAYTPTITASGTAFVAGNTSFNCTYQQVGSRVTCRGRIVMGSSGVTFGTGTYTISLPPVAPLAGSQSMGTAYFRDASAASTGHFPGICVVDASLSTTQMTLFNVTQSLAATHPFTWVATDHITFFLTYEAA